MDEQTDEPEGQNDALELFEAMAAEHSHAPGEMGRVERIADAVETVCTDPPRVSRGRRRQ